MSGLGDPVHDKRAGWSDGDITSAGPLMAIDEQGNIRGTVWVISGSLTNQAVRASNIWPDAPPVVMSIKITDDLIAFPGEGEERNLSAWIKGLDTVQEAWVNDVKVDVEEARKLVDKEFCISIRRIYVMGCIYFITRHVLGGLSF